MKTSARKPGRRCDLLTVILLLALAMSGCNSNPGPPAALTVLSATDLGTIPTNPDILGRDGAFSALFQGYSVWVYGDTFLAKPNAEGRGLISDSWSYTTDLNAQAGITGFQERLDSSAAPTMILPETPPPSSRSTRSTTAIRAKCSPAVRAGHCGRRQSSPTPPTIRRSFSTISFMHCRGPSTSRASGARSQSGRTSTSNRSGLRSIPRSCQVILI